MKQKKALLIDNNQTVQALCQLALEQVGLSVDILPDGPSALTAAQKLKPDLVICSRETKGIDPFIVCEQLKLAAPELKFILLASGQSASAISREAQGSGVDEVLLKPFKSEQLKQAAVRLLGGTDQKSPAKSAAVKPIIHLLLADSFHRRVLELFFDSRRVELKAVAPEAVLDESVPFVNQAAILDGQIALSLAAHTAKLRECTIIADHGSVAALRAQFPAAAVLVKPLTCESLVARFSKLYPEQQKDKPPAPLSSTEQAVLCAKISASVYERLLSSRALRERNWNEAGENALEELMRICKKFDAAIRG